MHLRPIREQINARLESLLDRGGPYGCYRIGTGRRPDLYATVDAAEIRTLMGEDLQALPAAQRQAWIEHINSYAGAGCIYGDRLGQHSAFHANGMVISALGPLGGRQPERFVLYDEFASIDKLLPWLERQDWAYQWRGSHELWGGLFCYSLSRECTPAWRAAMFEWLDRNLDERDGWWRKGTAHADRHQPLGGGSHIIPAYEHHGHPFPYPERTIDSVLAMQLPNARWQAVDSPHLMTYLELDALYVLRYLRTLAPTHRAGDVDAAVARYASAVEAYWSAHGAALLELHPHFILAAVGTFGLLQQLDADRFADDVRWNDIFSDRRLYRTDLVEALAAPGGPHAEDPHRISGR